MRNNGERQSGLIAIDIALLAALQLRVEQALSTTTDPTTRSLLTAYLQKVTTAQGELKRYQNDVSKMLRVEFTPPAPERTEMIAEMIAEMIGEVGEKSTHLNQEISHAADRRGEDWYSDAISRLLDMLRDLDELKAHLHELLGGSLTRTERAMLETLLRQIAEMQEAIARDLKTTASSAQLAAEMQRQETLAREKPLGSYSHLSWGVWGSEAMPGKPIYQNSHWIAGSLTPAAAIPVTGTASYNGQVVGQLNEAGALTTVTGTSSLTVLFDNRGLSGSFDNMKRANGTAWTSATVNATWGAGTNQISGTVNAANGMSGAVNASFFGPAANHVGGSWSLSGGGNQASGVFCRR
ncbi:MAG: transferrin-binding protein-like solute binding protein [Betaproteobacteria bacterium]|uniref:Transferrin-binding protein-like solute binding protein n=1 Tax=Candidatus Proximibacter danicus TaxID=2954365 RepID=A0A9D7K0E2_9PROT|nr:transferrin-binding protein-like solute binding protein [Candidatus Proximibacter danicus]